MLSIKIGKNPASHTIPQQISIKIDNYFFEK